MFQAKLGLKLLSDAGMIKVNFSGGEPFLHQRGIFLGELVKYCKEELYLDSVTVVTNGSRVTRKWFEDYGTYLDIMAVSCDSFDEEVNEKIGRHAKVLLFFVFFFSVFTRVLIFKVFNALDNELRVLINYLKEVS